MNTISRAIIAAGLVGVLAIVAIVLWGPRTPSLSGSGSGAAVPIAQPITPSTWPYSQLAILRTQRLSIDVLPASATKDRDKVFVETSARYLGRVGTETMWVVVDGQQQPCLVFLTVGGDGYTSACSTRGTPAAPGSLVLGGGEGDFRLVLMADGTVASSVLKDALGMTGAGAVHVAPNVWFTGPEKVVDRRPVSTVADPAGFPYSAPYADYAILRQEPLALDAVPKSLTGDDVFGDLDIGQLHYAGSSHGAKAWVDVNTEGKACLLVSGADGGTSFGCAASADDRAGGIGTGEGASSVVFQLMPDDVTASSEDLSPGSVLLAPNVWVSRGQ